MLRSGGRHRELYNQEECVPEGRTGSEGQSNQQSGARRSEAQPGDSQEASVGLRLEYRGNGAAGKGVDRGFLGW